MRLRIGDRLPEASPAPAGDAGSIAARNAPVYVVTDVLAETPWYGVYQGKRVLRNFRFETSMLEEADGEECLDVVLKTAGYARPDDPQYVQLRRRQAKFEASRVLGLRETNLLPEPLDLLEVYNEEDHFTGLTDHRFRASEPVLVMGKLHGRDLAAWRQAEQPPAWRSLRLMAELLDFITLIHKQRLLVNGLRPGAMQVDAMDRLHFLATDAVVDPAQAGWRSLFPPERYRQGFTAPESLDSTTSVDARADLYGFGALVFHLLAGISPAEIAAEQGRGFATFLPAHFDRLSASLASMSASEATAVGEWFGVQGSRFVRHWPYSFVRVLRACVDPRVECRPASVEAMRALWAEAPPPPVTAALGIRTASGVEILVSDRDLPGDLQLVVRSGEGILPTAPHEGRPVVRKPFARRLRVPSPADARTRYALFALIEEEGEEFTSAGVEVPVVDPADPGWLRQMAEDAARAEPVAGDLLDHVQVPAWLGLLEEHNELPRLCGALLDSPRPLVRRWASCLLERRFLKAPPSPPVEELLWNRGLADPRYDLRLASARALLRRPAPPDTAMLLRLAGKLSGEAIDDRLRAVRSLQSLGVGADAVEAAARALEADRAAACAVCGASVRIAEMDPHLVSLHGYVVVQGTLLPRPKAIERLWEEVLGGYEPDAALQLAELFVAQHGDQGPARFLDAFEDQFLQWAPDALDEQPEVERQWTLRRLAECLGAHEPTRRMGAELVRHEDQRLRDLGRRVAVPALARRFAGDSCDVEAMRQTVDRLCRRDSLDAKIGLCRMLADAGASKIAAAQCEKDFESTRPAVCPQCKASVAHAELARHLRQLHGVYEFRGRQVSRDALFRQFLADLLAPDPDFEAARMFADVLVEQFDRPIACGRLAELLLPTVERHLQAGQRVKVVAAARAVATTVLGADLAGLLIANPRPAAGELCLLLYAHLRAAAAKDLDQPVAERLGDVQLHVDSRREATIPLLRRCGDADMGRRVLEGLVKGAKDKSSQVALLKSLVPHLGRSPLVEAYCREIEDAMRMRCPECDTVLRAREMREHLLTAHGLVLQGRMVRSPWNVAEECLDDYITDPNPETLLRGEEMARLADPQQGMERYARSAIRKQIVEQRYRTVLERAAQQRQACICPSCYELVGAPPKPAPMPVAVAPDGTVSSKACSVRMRRGLAVNQVEIDAPATLPIRVRKESCISEFGAALMAMAAAAIPLATIAVLETVFAKGASIFTVAVAGAAILAVLGAMFLFEPRHRSALDTTWEVIVPPLLHAVPSPAIAAFLAGLAEASLKRGSPKRRRKVLARTMKACFGWVRQRQVSPRYLTPLFRLAVADHRRGWGGADAAAEMVAQLLRSCLRRELPLECLQMAAEDVPLLKRMSAQALLRQRYELCLSCFESRFSVGEVLDLCSESPPLAYVLGGGEPVSPELLSLWFAVLRQFPQGFPGSDGQTAFQLAQARDYRTLQRYPDLLAVSCDRSMAALVRGLLFERTLFDSRPRVSLSEDGPQAPGAPPKKKPGQRQLLVNGQPVPCRQSPQIAAAKIERWAELRFQVLQPAAESLVEKITDQTMRASADTVVRCPHCKQEVEFREGHFARAYRPEEHASRSA